MKHMVVNGTMAVLYINSMKEALKAFHKMCLLKIATNTPIISEQHPAMLLWNGGWEKIMLRQGNRRWSSL
jgi:hypothetical protein